MSYINFDRQKLLNFEYSLVRELLRSNRAGSYSSTTITGCNTRRYHGLLITRQPGIDNEHHVLLSSVDESVIQKENSANLGIHKFKGGVYEPKGQKYISDFSTEPIPKITYKIGGVRLSKEMLFTHNDDRVIIRYTLLEASSPTLLRLKPFLAFRNHHLLSKANIFIDTKYQSIPNGIRMCLYPHYSPLSMQVSSKTEYVHVPDWYRDIEYTQELERGYDYLEDLFVPGYFEVPIKKGESVYFIAGLEEINPDSAAELFEAEVARRIPRDSFRNCLLNSAHQFINHTETTAEVIAGYPWYNPMGRETFIALPGLTLSDGRVQNFEKVLNTMISRKTGPFFAQYGQFMDCSSVTADTSLWFFWTLQQYAQFTGKAAELWKSYGSLMLDILEAYKNGYCPSIVMHENGLIHAFAENRPLTWMNRVVDGKPVTQRPGYAVEINALWYNAIRFTLELATLAKAKDGLEEWTAIAAKIPASFREIFWNDERKYLCDYSHGTFKDWSVRPNQLFAASLPYSPLTEEQCKLVLDKVKSELLTNRGIRSLAPKNPAYIGVYVGNQSSRDKAAFQGTVYPWILAHFAEAYLKIHENSGLDFLKKLYREFENVIVDHGIGSISEYYDGDPPHHPGGAISMAWNVGELLRFSDIIQNFGKTPQKKSTKQKK